MTILAYLNHGRWVVDCPDPDCGGAAIAGDLFVCENCKRIAPIEWPKRKSLIDEITAVRPVPGTRNWTPGEPVIDLLKENKAHGLDGS